MIVRDGEPVIPLSGPVGMYCSSTDAELKAMLLGLKYLAQEGRSAALTRVCLDSQGAIKALKRGPMKQKYKTSKEI